MIELLTSHPNAPHAVAALEALESLDDTFLQKARLGIMSTLLALGEADFKLLKETLALSDGNLSTHLAVLEERGYVHAHKEFVRRKPRTTYTPTDAGRAAFQRYLAALERIIRAANSSEPTEPRTQGTETEKS
jgi:DNA-binding MarR family transcriptional regulator